MSAGRALLVGVDEAGLGPLLGPLAIGYSAIEAPAPDSNPWRLLNRVVARRPTAKSKRLVVADSKRVFTRNERGWKRLEATVLAFRTLLEAQRVPPADASALFRDLAPDRRWLERSPWYERLPTLPRVLDPHLVELKASLLERHLQRADLRLVDAGVRLVPASELNASYERTHNKGESVWGFCLEVLRHIWERRGEKDPWVTVDLLGGRTHYGALLARGFPEAEVSVLEESEECSAYLLLERDEEGRCWLPRRMRLEFRPKGEDASFSVALASCFAKYTREVVMAGFNDYFGTHQPDLRPTAGYTTDGRRWLSEAEEALQRACVDREVLVRNR